MARSIVVAVLLLGLTRVGVAGVLPEDRVDVLLHSYDGGGVTIQGPSVLVRKQFAQKFSASANYYVDRVSSASIDVITTASPYKEERTQKSVGLDYLHDRWTMSLGLINSKENDYTADTFSFGISQDLFGDLTTISLGYSLGSDQVRRRGDATFEDTVRRQDYRLGLSQILTKNLLVGVSFETITDEGFLNNPYRQVRYLDRDQPDRIQLRARAVSAHAHERRGRCAHALLPAVSRGAVGGVPRVPRHVGRQGHVVRDRLHASARQWLDVRGQAALVLADEGGFLQRPVPALGLSELHRARQGAQHVREPVAADRGDATTS